MEYDIINLGGIMNQVSSAYIHIPFCKSICSYCDFCKMFYNSSWVDNYLKELEKEIKFNYNGEVLNTVYIGGGTPNCLNDTELEDLLKIVSTLKRNISYEYTIECNIELLTLRQIKLFKKYGVNRVSVGVQTFNKKYLKLLNRNHSKEEVFSKVNLLRKEGISDINIDLIYAIPGETKEELLEDIRIIKELDIPHVSTYSLMIEPHTVLNNMKTKPISEDLDYEMYELIINELDNYKHYETSNFAKDGYESKHNTVYWNNEHYYGFGLNASGYIGNVRYENTRVLKKYLDGNYIKDKEELSINETIENEFILGLRKLDGINKKVFRGKYGIDILDISIVEKLLEKGKLIDNGSYIKLSSNYTYIANSVLIDFLGVNYEE